MTDLQAFIDLYSRFEIDLNINTDEENGLTDIILTPVDFPGCDNRSDLTVSEKFIGFPGFYSQIEFKDGEFLRQIFREGDGRE